MVHLADHRLGRLASTPPKGGRDLLGRIVELEQELANQQAVNAVLSDALEGMENAILMARPDKDGDWRICLSNQRTSEMLEIPESTIRMGALATDALIYCMNRGDDVDVTDTVLKMFRSGPDGELMRQLPSGRWVMTKFRHTPAGEVIVTFTDLTEHKGRECELGEANELLDELIQEMGQGLVVYTGNTLAERKPVLTNAKFAEMLELPQDMPRLGLPHKEMLEFFEQRGDFCPKEIEKLNAYRRISDGPGMMNLNYNLPSGRVVRSVGCSRASGDGRIVTFSDITELVQADRERASLAADLGHMQRLQAIGKLTGGVAHDFNNLLAVILGNAQLLEMVMGPDDESLRDIVAAAERGADLTQRLLAFSRKQALSPEPIDLSVKMTGMRRMLQRTLGETISIEMSIAEDQWNCFADVGQLENAILNLAVNSRDAMPEGGFLSIQTSNIVLDSDFAAKRAEVAVGEYALIEVTDDGTGMSEELLEHVFEPFFTTKEVGHGSGLGLSMVFGFVKQSSGHLCVRSTPGQGTTVRIYLPRATEVVKVPVQARPVPVSKFRESIVVVEDDPSVRSFVVRALSALGYTVSAYSDAVEALRQVANHDHVDLLITDIVLPGGVNGRQLGQQICELMPGLRVIYMSGYSEDAVFQGDEESQHRVLLHKPFSMDEIARAVKDVLSDGSVAADRS